MGIHTDRPRAGLSLCAGYGGLDMGLQLAEPGFHTRCFVEIEPDAQAALVAGMVGGYLPGLGRNGSDPDPFGPTAAARRRARSFQPAPVWDNLRTFVGHAWRGHIDTILAGYPCQPFSAAGQRRGADDDRHLWPDVARIINEVQPEWCFLENVAGHISLGLETVLRDLWKMGYAPAAGAFSAAETGAPHERLRVFIVAHTDGGHARAEREQRGGQQRFQPEGRGTAQGALGPPEGIGRREGRAEPEIRIGRDADAGAGGAMADPGRAELEGQFRGQHHPGGWQEPDGYPALPGRTRLHPPGPSDAQAWADILATSPHLAPATSLRDCLAWAGDMAAALEGEQGAAAESAFCLLASGLASRSSALRGLGNGVHPLTAAYAWRELSRAHGLSTWGQES